MALQAETQRGGLFGAALQLWALLLGVALLLAGNGLQGTLLGVVAEDTGFSAAVTGLIMTAFYVGFLFGSAGAERLIAKVGHVRTFAALASAGSIAILIHGLAIEPATWAAMRFITGFSFAGLYVVAESWLARSSDNTFRGGLLAVYMIVQHAGLTGGQILMNAAPTSGLTLYVVTSIIISAALIPILLSSAPQPHVVMEVERLSLSKLYRTSPLGVVGCLMAGVANGIILGMSAVFARRLELDVAAVSVFVAAIMVGGAALQWPVGKLSDRLDRRKVIAGVAALTALAALALGPAAVAGGVWLTVSGFVLGGLALTLYPLALSHTNDWLDPDQMTAASGALVMVYGAGAVLGPLGAGLFMGWIGPDGFTVYLAVVAAALAAFAVFRITRREAPESTEDYLPVGAAMGSGEYVGEAMVEAAESDPA
ncbi:MAG: MFS transporter [Oceanicaulis sp.]